MLSPSPLKQPQEWLPRGPFSPGLSGSPRLRHRTPFGEMLMCCPDPKGRGHTQLEKQPLPWALGLSV